MSRLSCCYPKASADDGPKKSIPPTENSLSAHELHILVQFYFQLNPSTSRVSPFAMQSGVSLLSR
jgi:hypothetical protein